MRARDADPVRGLQDYRRQDAASATQMEEDSDIARSASHMRDDEDLPHIVVALAGTDDDQLWGKVAEALGERYSVSLAPRADANEIQRLVRSKNRPAIIVAHGISAIRHVCRIAATGDAVRALALIEGAPPSEYGPPSQPTLILRGRQSEDLTHSSAVAAFERLRAGRIVELENCGSEPQRDQPEALVSAISWFAETLGQLERPAEAE